MISGEKEIEARRNCPHDVNDLLKQEREYMPVPCGKDGLVWCDGCKVWIPFEWSH